MCRPTTTPAGHSLVLGDTAEPGTSDLALVATSGVAVGDVLRVGTEYVAVVALDPVAPRVGLASPLGLRHRRGDDVVVQDVAVDGTSPLLATAEVGDAVLMLDATAVADGKVVRLRAGGVADQVRTTRHFRAVTGADGQWTFPPLAGVAEIELSVTASGRTLFPPVGSNPTLRLAAGAASQRRDFAMH